MRRRRGASLIERLRGIIARVTDPFPADPRPLLDAIGETVVSVDTVNEIVGRTHADPPWRDPDRSCCGSGVSVAPRGVVLTATRAAAGEPALWVKGGGSASRARILALNHEACLAAYHPATPPRARARLDLRRVPDVGEPLLLVARRPTGPLASTIVRVAAVHLDVRIAPKPARWNLLELDGPLIAAGSGAPLFDRRGRVVAIAARDMPEEGDASFAIPLAPWRPVVRAILRGRRIDPPYFGVSGHNQWIEARGRPAVLVTAIDRNTAAFAAGIRPFDCIVGIDGDPIDDLGVLQERVRTAMVGTILIVEILRDDGVARIPVRLESTRLRARRQREAPV